MASPRSWATSSGSISPRGGMGPLISGVHRSARKESETAPPPQPSQPPSTPSTPPLPEVSPEELPGIVKRLFAELEDDFEVAYRTQKQVGLGKPNALRQALEDQVAGQLTEIQEHTKLSPAQAALIGRAQQMHLEKLWFIFTTTNQTRPDRLLADDPDLSMLLRDLANPVHVGASAVVPATAIATTTTTTPTTTTAAPSAPAVAAPPAAPASSVAPPSEPAPTTATTSRSSTDRPASPRPSPRSSVDPESLTSSSSGISGGFTRSVRNSQQLRLSGTHFGSQRALNELPRPVSPRSQGAQTGTLIVGRRNSTTARPVLPLPPSPPTSPTSQQQQQHHQQQQQQQQQPLQLCGSGVSQLPPLMPAAVPPPPATPPPPVPPLGDSSPPVAALAYNRRPSVPPAPSPRGSEVAKSRTDLGAELGSPSGGGVTIPGPAHHVPANEPFHHTLLRTLRELREDPSRARQLTGNPQVQIAMAVLLLLAVILMFKGGPSAPHAAPLIPLPPLDPAVAALLDRLNYQAYKALLAAQRVDWVALNYAKPETLVAIGIPLGHAMRITAAVAEPLHVDQKSGDITLDTAAVGALLKQSAAVALISSNPSKTVQRIKAILSELGATVRESVRDADALVVASLPPAAWRKALQSTLALSPYNHHRTNVQEVGTEIKSKQAALQLVESEASAARDLLERATLVSDQVAARNYLHTLEREKQELSSHLQTLQAGTATSSLVITVRPQDFTASGPPPASFLFSMLNLVFNTPLFFVLAGIGYGIYRYTVNKK